MKKNKELFEEGEGNQYFLRNVPNSEMMYETHSDAEIRILSNWLLPHKEKINSICEIGCSGGHRLQHLVSELEADGYGLDPSKSAIEYIRQNFPKLNAEVGCGDNVPFSGEFDLVHLGFFLYLVDRELYLKNISEADRLVKFGGFLSILDFDVPTPYSNQYKHKDGGYSHKINNSNVFIASGLYTVVNKFTYDLSAYRDPKFTDVIDNRVSMTLLYKEKDIFKV
ncbi:class I SAM-dependent methyltransferase [Algicola sagamiensis]|uniref:class I SAM-dependent methyltransferase n=1 Tax=Algicola sagamiensis TaxID=163869 RepID=UPI00036D2482|nr:class I SAM-dependent methyltransferase [Algicola sagamiensis]